MLRASVSVLTAFTSLALSFKPCVIPGPDFPAPSELAKDSVFQGVLENISSSLDNATESSSALLTNLKSNETSYSVAVFDVESTLLSYHHTADALALAPKSVSNITGRNTEKAFNPNQMLNMLHR